MQAERKKESLPQGAVKSIFIFDGSFFSLIHYGREVQDFTSLLEPTFEFECGLNY
jgi:hypothetical protein